MGSSGIPKFYRWLSERYPLLNMPVTAAEAPPGIDNLYLDMNGIIHNCTHANDPNLKLTETEMILRIFNYLDKLIQIMKPKKLVFLAIDGGLTALSRCGIMFTVCHGLSIHRSASPSLLACWDVTTVAATAARSAAMQLAAGLPCRTSTKNTRRKRLSDGYSCGQCCYMQLSCVI